MRDFLKNNIAKYLINFVHVFVLFLCSVNSLILILGFLKNSISTDFPWLLATGNYILKTHSIPSTDIFSWTFPDKQLVVYQWLFEVLISFLHLNFGINLLVKVFSVLFLIIYIIIPIYFNDRKKTFFIFTLLILNICLYISSSNLSIRPMIFTSLFLLFQYIFYERIQENKINKLISIIIITLLYVIWSNFHLGFILGIFSSLIFLITNFFDKNFQKSKEFLILIFVSIFSSLVNPYGLSLYEYLYDITFTNNMSSFINEIQILDLHIFKFQLFFILFLLTIIIQFTKKAFTSNQFIHLMLFSFATFLSQRFVIWSCLYFAMFLPSTIHKIFTKISQLESVINKFNFYKPIYILLIFTILIFVFALQKSFSVDYGICSKFLNNIETYQKHYKKPTDVLFQDQIIGTCSLLNYPNEKVFADTRFDFYEKEFVNDWRNTLLAEKGYENFLKSWKINTVFILKEWPLFNKLLNSNEYEIVYDDKDSVILKRRIEAL